MSGAARVTRIPYRGTAGYGSRRVSLPSAGVVSRTLVIAAAAAALALVPAAHAQAPLTLMPGVTYEDGVQFTAHGPVALHVIRAPRPGGLYAVKALLSNEAILGREPVTAIQKRLATQATTASVDGDLFRADGRPVGMLVRDGVLDHAPVPTRSSAGFDATGTLRVGRVELYGTWRGTGQRRTLDAVNEPAAAGQVVLFTSAWGAPTPRAADTVDVVLGQFPAAAPNTDLAGPVAQVVPGGGTTVPAGGAVLQARGKTIVQKVLAEAPPGTRIVSRLNLQSGWAGVGQAFGGGPLLVRDGKAVFRNGETFTAAQQLPRQPRAAIGQTRDGSVLLVAVDGSQPGYSVGMTGFELALALQRLGAVWAMGLGGGPAATMAFDGALLNSPSSGEQPAAEAVSVVYYGVYAPPPAPLFSPNGDGVAETQSLSYKLVRPASVRAVLVGPDGVERAVDEGRRDPGTYTFPFTGADAAGAPLPEGTWRWRVAATDDQGAASTAERTFAFDRTLAAAAVEPPLLRAGASGGTVTVTARLSRPAKVTLRIETTRGSLVRELAGGNRPAGALSLAWDARLPKGQVVHSGRFVAKLVAVSEVGTSDLAVPFTVRRVAGA